MGLVFIQSSFIISSGMQSFSFYRPSLSKRSNIMQTTSALSGNASTGLLPVSFSISTAST
jgi:hypothetical protein